MWQIYSDNHVVGYRDSFSVQTKDGLAPKIKIFQPEKKLKTWPLL